MNQQNAVLQLLITRRTTNSSSSILLVLMSWSLNTNKWFFSVQTCGTHRKRKAIPKTDCTARVCMATPAARFLLCQLLSPNKPFQESPRQKRCFPVCEFPSAVMFPTLLDYKSAYGAHLGPSSSNIQGTEVVIWWWEEHTGKSGRPFCLLCEWLHVDRETVWEINVSRTPGAQSGQYTHKRFCYFPV